MENELTKLKINIAGTDLEYEGNEKFLKNYIQKLLDIVKNSHNEQVKKILLNIVEDLQLFLIQMDDYSKKISLIEEQLSHIFNQCHKSFNTIFDKIEQQEIKGDDLLKAIKEMQEMNQSFNLQYLQLQQDMQAQNRQFTLVSNIMKTKHDTAKNAINNVR